MGLRKWLLVSLLLVQSSRGHLPALHQSPQADTEIYRRQYSGNAFVNSLISVGESMVNDIFPATSSASNPPSATVQPSAVGSRVTTSSSRRPTSINSQPSPAGRTSGTSQTTTTETSSTSQTSSTTVATSTTEKSPEAVSQTNTLLPSPNPTSSDLNPEQHKVSGYKDIIVSISVLGGILLVSLCIMTIWACLMRKKRFQRGDHDDEALIEKKASPYGSEKPPSIMDPDAPAYAYPKRPASSYTIPITYDPYHNSSSSEDHIVSPLEPPVHGTPTYQAYSPLRTIADVSRETLPSSPAEMEGNQAWLGWIPRKSSKRVYKGISHPERLESHGGFDFGFAGRRSPGYQPKAKQEHRISRKPLRDSG